jgi:potassium efflux system protein
VICGDHRQLPERVIQLLETTALTIPRVLNDPASRGLLLRYDASGLTYAIRYWIEDPMNGISIASELGSAAWHALDAAGIAIALPRLVLQNDARTQI